MYVLAVFIIAVFMMSFKAYYQALALVIVSPYLLTPLDVLVAVFSLVVSFFVSGIRDSLER